MGRLGFGGLWGGGGLGGRFGVGEGLGWKWKGFFGRCVRGMG